MQLKTVILTLSLIACLAASAAAQGTIIPRYTVIPVVLDNGLNSATSNVGDRFTTHCAQANCGGFPDGTTFVGQVGSVVRGSGSKPGQIEVRFIEANLLDGTKIPINGILTGLSSTTVYTDASTGRLMARPGHRTDRNKFIAYGAGAGLLIGVLARTNIIKGTLIGAAAGWLFGALQKGSARDVNVPAGTQFGIMLNNSVTLPSRTGAGPGAPTPTDGFDVILRAEQPYVTSAGILMVPFREVMNGIGQPFIYRGSTKTVSLSASKGLVEHTAGTGRVYVNGALTVLSARSRIVGGILYVPSDFITVATGRTVAWLPDTRTLRIR